MIGEFFLLSHQKIFMKFFYFAPCNFSMLFLLGLISEIVNCYELNAFILIFMKHYISCFTFSISVPPFAFFFSLFFFFVCMCVRVRTCSNMKLWIKLINLIISAFKMLSNIILFNFYLSFFNSSNNDIYRYSNYALLGLIFCIKNTERNVLLKKEA